MGYILRIFLASSGYGLIVRLRIALDFVVCNQCLENLVVDASSEMSKC